MGGEGGHGSRIFNGLEQSVATAESKKQEEADSCYKFPLSIIIVISSISIVVVELHRSSRCLITTIGLVVCSPRGVGRGGSKTLQLPLLARSLAWSIHHRVSALLATRLNPIPRRNWSPLIGPAYYGREL